MKDAVPTPAKKSGLTEAQFLAQQAEDAKRALDKTWTDLKHSITNNADVRLWTQQYPWIATAAAVAAGMAAGYTITPRSRDEAVEMWEHIKDQFKPAEPSADAPPQKAVAQPSVLGSILKEALKVAGPLLASLASGAVSDKTAARSDNGHTAENATETETPLHKR